MGLPVLGPDMSCILSAQASALVWIATLVASATVLVITLFITCSDAMTYFISISLSLTFLTSFLLLTPCNEIMPYYDNNARCAC